MPRTISLIQSARIASPCDMKWEDMTGDDRMRHCSQCNLSVYNFRDMTEAEANALLANATGRVCGRLWRRKDGTIITQDCPRGLAAVRWRICTGFAKVAAAFVVLGTAIAYGRIKDDSPQSRPWETTYSQANRRIMNWLNGPSPSQTMVMGDIAMPPTNPTNANNAGIEDCFGDR